MKNKILQTFGSMRRGAAMLLLLVMCVTHAWANSYWYRGGKNSWGDSPSSPTAMTVSDDGMFEYCLGTYNGHHEFKITNYGGNDKWGSSTWGCNYTSSGFCRTDITNMNSKDNTWSKGDNGNIDIYNDNNNVYYILVYYPNTAVNSSSDPKICASTYLPDAGYETDGNTMTYYSNLNAKDQTTSALDRKDGSTTALGTVTSLYLKGFNSKMWQHGEGNIYGEDAQHYYFKVHRTAVSAGSTGFTDVSDATNYSAGTWNWSGGGDWSSNYRKPTYNVTCNHNLLSGLGSGNYTMSYYFVQEGSRNFRLPSDAGDLNTLTWTIAVPAISSPTCTSNGTGTGASGSPFSVADGNTLTITVSGSQASSDANSVLYAKFGSNEYSSTLTYDIVPTTTPASITVKAKYYNSADKLSGTEQTWTIWYVSTADPSLAISSFSQGGGNVTAANSGSTVTINASRQNAGTATITYEYSTSSTFASDVHEIAETTSTTQTWELPACTSTTTYYVRASMEFDSESYSDIESITVYGKKTIKVKDTNAWGANFYLHTWGGTGNDYPGSTDNTSAYGSGQWKQVVLYSSSTNFLLAKGPNSDSADGNKTANQTFAGVSDGGCYEIGSGSSTSLTLTSTANCPSKPTSVTTSAASSVTNTTATINGSIGGNGNDNITDYGFYWSANADYDTPAELISSGTKVQKGTSNYTGSLTHDLTSLTAGNTIHYIAYATNGQGTTNSTPAQSFVVPYSVEVQKPTGCSSITPSAGNYYYSTGFTVTTVAATGYTFSNWSATNGTTSSASSPSMGTNTVTFTPTANSAVIKPIYTENSYPVSVSVSPAAGGSLSPTPSDGKITVKQVTGTNITANKNTNYVFDDWTISGGGITPTTSSTSPQNFKATTTGGTIQANFSSQWTIAGSMYNNFDWSKNSNLLGSYTTEGGKVIATVTISLAANTTYTFKVKDRSQNQNNGWYGIASGSTATYTYADDNTYKDITTNSGNQNISLTTAAAGDYVFRFNLTDKKVAVDFPTSRQITIGQKSIYDPAVTNTSDATTTGGYVTAEDNSSNTITTGQYVADGANVTFTAHPATGYAFKGWYQNADCTTPYVDNSATENTVVIDAEAKALTLNNITENKAVYAKYEEIMTRISILTYGGKFSVDGGDPTDTYNDPYLQVGVKTTHTVSIASEDAGYYFSNWELSASEDEEVNYSISGLAENEDNRSITVTGLGVETRTQLNFLEPKFKQLESIYFRNIFDDGETVTHWENVYVHFATQWADYSGKQAVKTSNDDCYANLHVQMEEIGSSHIFRAYVPRFVTRYTKTTVAFANSEDVYKDSYLYTGSASGRSDYKKEHNMFVPYHSKTRDVNGVAYYNEGYWMHYTISEGVDAGYWIEERTKKDTYSGKPSDQFVILNSAFDKVPQIRYRLRIDGTSDKNYAIFSEGGIKYKASSTITHANCTDVVLTEDNNSDAYFTITPTAEGEYILTIDQSGDQMKLSVEYPIVAGDYVIENAYNDGTAKTTRTNIIKSANAGTKTRYSMYLNNAGPGTLKLRKCNSIDGSGNPVWSTGYDTNLSGILSDGDFTPGVYQFDITINTSTDKVSKVDSVRLYTGNFYIKTDAASGGWVSYKNNILTKNTVNFDRADASTFDHYFCKYFASKDCNIKSVIANDYCNQLSDTVKGDGIARMYEGEPYVPIDGTSIRFSYNSATNETKRAYLGASYHNGFLNIVPSTDNKVYRTISATKYDLYDYPTDSAKLKFEDNGNYVYEMDVTVIPGAMAGVRAAYNDGTTNHKQMLIPSTNTLLGGTGSSEYSIRIVYDFKTNFMMSAFVLTDTPIEENLADFDMLWVRHKDESPTQLTLGDKKTLSNVRPIGAIEFRYDEMCSSSSSGDRVDLSSWSVYSRPYLKYFISFPFDVHVGSVFGLNDAYYGLDYVIQKYDGATRAADGLFAGDGDNYWINLTQDSIMHANEGYCLILDNDYARWSSSSDMWYNKGAGSSAFIYFPAMEEIESIGSSETAVTKVPQHECKVDRAWAGSKSYLNHMQTDSHWNLIGQPFFHDAYMKSSSDAIDTLHLASYYYLDYSDNKWHIQAFDKDHHIIKAMSSFFVQWAGDITWTLNAVNDKWKDTPVAAAPSRANTEVGKNYLIKLDVEFNGKVSDWAFVRLEDHANDDFVLREDMFKMYNNGIPNIYTFAGAYDAAYNAVPVKNQTIRMGVIIRKNGTYKFSMPSDFSGTVTLIDQFAQTRTNLALDDYTVDLTKGTINDRFELEINVNNAPTAIDGVTDGSGSLKDGKAHKFIMNDMLYILKDGVLYDARGNRVK